MCHRVKDGFRYFQEVFRIKERRNVNVNWFLQKVLLPVFDKNFNCQKDFYSMFFNVYHLILSKKLQGASNELMRDFF